MSFLNSSSGRPKISLGGNSRRPQTNAELVARMRIQREQRERERQINQAATLLQSVFRSKRDANATVHALQLRIAAHVLLQQHQQQQQQQQQLRHPSSSIAPTDDDDDHHHHYRDHHQPINRETATTTTTTTTTSSSSASAAATRLPRMTHPSPSCILPLGIQPPHQPPLSSPAAALVLAATVRSIPGSTTPPTAFRLHRHLPLLRNALALRFHPQEHNPLHARVKVAVALVAAAAAAPEIPGELVPACLSRATSLLMEIARDDAVSQEISQIIVEWPLFESIARLLRPPPSTSHTPRAGALRALIDAALGATAQDNALLWRKFHLTILTIPGSVSFLNLSHKRPQFVAKVIASLTAHDNFYPSLNEESLFAVLDNVLLLAGDIWASGDSSRIWPLVSILILIMDRVVDIWLSSRKDQGDETWDDSDEEYIESTSDTAPMDMEFQTAQVSSEYRNSGAQHGMSVSRLLAGSSEARSHPSQLREFFRRKLSALMNEDLIRGLFIAAAKDGRSATVRVCKLFNIIARPSQKLQMSLQSVLAFWAPASELASVPTRASQARYMLPRLWETCCNEDEMDLEMSGDLKEVLLLFVRSYSHFLYVQDEDQMFESGLPFSIDEVRSIARTLKDALFRALWSSRRALNSSSSVVGTLAPTSVETCLLTEETSRLLSQLYTCDSRYPFRTSDEFWIGDRILLSSTSFLEVAVASGADGYPSAQNVPGRERESRTRPHISSLYSYNGINSHRPSTRPKHVTGAGELLRLAPYIVPFSSRARIFYTWVAAERSHHGSDLSRAGGSTLITVRRNYLLEDAISNLNWPGDRLRAVIRVQFVDEHGITENGIDGGGLYKEFLHELLGLAFSPSHYGLFLQASDGRLYPNPDAGILDGMYLQRLEFIGKMLGKAIFDGVLVDIPLATFFISKILRKFNYPSDLKSLDPDLYKHLTYLRTCTPDEVEALDLNFIVSNTAFGQTEEVELVKGGRNITVTAENRIEFIHRYSNYRLNIRLRKACDAFIGGFLEVIRLENIRLFSERELQSLISGFSRNLDVGDLRRNTNYSGECTEESDIIQWFWQIVSEMSADEQTQLLKFVTSSPRAPLLGFKYMYPAFCIHCGREDDDDRLPSASTCMNLLKIPKYKDKETLRAKLKYSISENTGFSLS